MASAITTGRAAAEGEGPGCGSLTFDPACLRAAVPTPVPAPLTPFGAAQEDAPAKLPVSRSELERRFDARDGLQAEPDFVGLWQEALSVRWDETSGLYDPAPVVSTSPVRLGFLEIGGAPLPADARDSRTPFGAPGAITGVAASGDAFSARRPFRPAGMAWRFSSGELRLTPRDGWRTGSFPEGPARAEILCRLLRAKALLCRLTIAEETGAPRVEYYGFLRHENAPGGAGSAAK